MSRKRLIFLIAGLILGLLLIRLWLRSINVDEVLLSIRNVRPDLVVWAALAYLSAYFIRSWRWNLLLRTQARIPLGRSFLYSMGGNWVNYLIPIRAGEVAKAWFVKRNHGTPMLNVLPSIFIDKTFDTLGIIFVLLMVPLLRIRTTTGLTVLLILLGFVFAASLGILLLSVWHKEGVVRFLQFFFTWLPQKWREIVFRYIAVFIQGLNVFEQHWTRLLYAVLLTAIGVGLDGLYFYLLFLAFGVSFPFVTVLFGYTLINLSYALPQPPAQLGSNEWMMIIIFSVGFALTKDRASAIMAFAHVLTAILIGVIGFASIAVSGRQVLKAIIRGDKIYEQ
ncbi:MAG: flippase-like domain-containing protein [Candidatus Cloacimonetes bacterium]|nr:flippase-like domain-containing protein [Candidatus Cloacimonadota bacterium]